MSDKIMSKEDVQRLVDAATSGPYFKIANNELGDMEIINNQCESVCLCNGKGDLNFIVALPAIATSHQALHEKVKEARELLCLAPMLVTDEDKERIDKWLKETK